MNYFEFRKRLEAFRNLVSSELNILKDIIISGNLNIDESLLVDNLQLNNQLYNIPEILTAPTDPNSNTELNRTLISQKVVTILSWPNSQPDTIWFLKLDKGTYNGQRKQIALHPQWNGNHVNIAVLSFIDPEGNIFNGTDFTNNLGINSNPPAQLLLHSGGQTLNLMYIDNDNDINNNINNPLEQTGGYWTLLSNNFDYT